MKVLHIMNSLMPSGAETMLNTAKDVFPVQDMHIMATFENVGPYAETLEKAGYTIHHIFDSNRSKHHKKIRDFIKKNCFDVVHIHCEGESVIYALDCKIVGVKTIIRTVHSLFEFEGMSRVRHILFRWTMRKIGVKFVFISTDVAKNEEKRFRNAGVTIENWCDPKFAFADQKEKEDAVQKTGLAADRFYLIVVGNCDQNKNHRMVIDCIAKLDTEIDIGLIHIGKGDEKEQKYVREKKIEDKVHFCGFTDPLIWLKAADCYVCPSLREGFSISTLEALSVGLPCVLSNIDGLHFYREKGFDEIQYPDIDVDAFCEAIRKVYYSGNYILKRQAKLAQSVFGVESGAEKYLRLYEGKQI